ncbi:MAG: efflux RND transporter periplasmic adaptor subunit [Gemmatimonadetes bacterium]|nr:efflux RND transporter periplasmic adaptor subunit [Gemmatimonadota bacterium]
MPVQRVHSRIYVAAVAAALATAAGCSRDADAVPEGGAGGAGGASRSPSVTLAASDVATPRRIALEDAIPVTGTLDPLDRSEVRARLEGDLTGVYVREGEPVRAGQLLAAFDASDQSGDQRSAQADLASARTDLSTAQWNLDQTKDLYTQGAVAQSELRVREQGVAAARARVAAAEARVQNTRNRVTDTRVVAPAAGVIEKRGVTPGEHVSRGASLFTIVRGDVLELAASVPERSAAAVRPGQPVRFVADGRTFDGRVARVGPSVDPASRAVTVYVQVPNGSGALKAGTFASGRIVSRVLDNALVVPLAALHEGKEGAKPTVYRVAGGKIDVTQVTPGLTDESQGVVQIVDGLAEGDRVVVGNVGMLGKGMKVRMAGEGGRGGR